MASVIESYNSTVKEAYTGIKILLWSIPLAFVISPANKSNIMMQLIMGFLLFAFITTLARNVIAKKPTIVPGINFFEMAYNGCLGLIAILPTAILGGAIFYLYSNFVHIPDFVWNQTLLIVVGLLALSLPITSLAILVRNMNILECFNIQRFLYACSEVFLSFSFFLIRAGLFIGIVIGFLYYLFSLFIGFTNSFWIYLIAGTSMLSIILIGNAIAQICDEIYALEQDRKVQG